MLEIEDCGIIDTGIPLPWVFAGHSCAVSRGSVYLCGSLYNLFETKCTGFNGKFFFNVPSTTTGHAFGSMVTFKESPVILGGKSNDDRIDYDQVEVLASSGDTWVALSSLPEPMRLFSTVSFKFGKVDTIVVFGGFSGAKNSSLKGSYWFQDNAWTTGPGICHKFVNRKYYRKCLFFIFYRYARTKIWSSNRAV